VNDIMAVLTQAGRWGLAALALALLLYMAAKALQRYRLIQTLRMARIGVEELDAMLQQGERPLIVDVRSPASQQHGRIPGAVWIDHKTLDSSVRQSGLAQGQAAEVIVYCACPNEASAAVVAKKLMRAGFKRVRPLSGGIEAWTQRGYAVEMPAAPSAPAVPVAPQPGLPAMPAGTAQ
jgi:rhodanese-related sulfurtransferase